MPVPTPLPPVGWETAQPISVRRLLKDPTSKAWLRSELDRLPPGLASATAEETRGMLALLAAQVRHYRKATARYDEMPADLKSRAEEAQMRTARSLFHRHRETGKPLPRPAWHRAELKWGSAKATARVCGYDWLAQRHRRPALRLALCYEKTQFRRLVRQYGLRPRRRGREDSFPCRDALRLLTHRLKPGHTRSREIAERIWDLTALRTRRMRDLPKDFAKLRRLLVAAGCPCTLAPDGRPDFGVHSPA